MIMILIVKLNNIRWDCLRQKLFLESNLIRKNLYDSASKIYDLLINKNFQKFKCVLFILSVKEKDEGNFVKVDFVEELAKEMSV